jgi:hypothetical protein
VPFDEAAETVCLRRVEAHFRFINETDRAQAQKQRDADPHVRLQPVALILDASVIRHLIEGEAVVDGRKVPVSNPQGEPLASSVIRPDCLAEGSDCLSSKFATSGVVQPK